MTFIGHGVRQGMWRTASVEICAPIIPDSRDTLGLVRKRKKKRIARTLCFCVYRHPYFINLCLALPGSIWKWQKKTRTQWAMVIPPIYKQWTNPSSVFQAVTPAQAPPPPFSMSSYLVFVNSLQLAIWLAVVVWLLVRFKPSVYSFTHLSSWRVSNGFRSVKIKRQPR